mgnify:CR=1 FL=1
MRCRLVEYFSVLAVVVLSGCAFEKQALSSESKVYKSLIPPNVETDQILFSPVMETARYAIRVSDRYKELGDKAAADRDALSALIIAAASGSAIASAAGAGSSEAARLALGGAVIYQGAL